MNHELFPERRKAFEESFFARVNDQLRREFQDHEADKERHRALAQACGVTDDKVLDHMMALHIGPETIAALALIPLVEVAWADGHSSKEQRAAVLHAAREHHLAPDSPSHRLLEHWLEHPPEPAMVAEWKEYIGALCKRLNPVLHVMLERELLGRARTVAAAAHGFLGLRHKPSPAARRVLAEMGQAFVQH